MDLIEPDSASRPACVFRPWDRTPRSIFARGPDGTLVHISEAEPGQRDLTCPDCGWPMAPKKLYKDKAEHYAHYANNEECKHAGETALHETAKEILSDDCVLLLPAAIFSSHRGPSIFQKERRVRFREVHLEVRQGNIQPDLICIVEETGELLYLEIRVTHPVDNEKFSRLARRGIATLEINLSRVDRELDRPSLVRQVLEAAPRTWIYHPDVSKAAETERREQEDISNRRRRAQARSEALKAKRDEIEAMALTRQSRARALAMRDPPSGASPALLEQAKHAQILWKTLGLGSLFEIEAADHIFDVEPLVWRAATLSTLAPWNNPQTSGDASRAYAEKDLPTVPYGTLVKSGCVKAGFLMPATQDAQDANLIDPSAAQAAMESFRSRAIKDLAKQCHDADRGNPVPSACSVLKDLWKDRQGRISAVETLRAAARSFGLDFNIDGYPIVEPSDITRLFESDHTDTTRISTWRCEQLAQELTTGDRPIRRFMEDPHEKTEPIFLSLPGDSGPGATERAREEIHAQHVSDWRDKLEALAWREAQSLSRTLSPFVRTFPATWSHVASVLELDPGSLDQVSEQLHPQLTVDLPLNDRRPFEAAKHALKAKAEKLGRRLYPFVKIADLVAQAPSRQIAERLALAGTMRAVQIIAEDGHAYRFLSPDREKSILAHVDELVRLANRDGLGPDFAERVLSSCPPGQSEQLFDLLFGEDPVLYRKPLRQVVSTPHRCEWVLSDVTAAGEPEP